MYVCQKKSVDGGKTWGNLTYPFGREIATREPSPVYDFIHDKLMLVANLMDSQLIMVPLSVVSVTRRLCPMMRAIRTLPWRTSTRRWVQRTRPTSAWATDSKSEMVRIAVVW